MSISFSHNHKSLLLLFLLILQHFEGYGTYQGKITMLPSRGHDYYRVYYSEDDDEEDIPVDKITQYILNEEESQTSNAKKERKKGEDGGDQKPAAAKASAAVHTAATTRNEGEKHFKAKYRPVYKIEYQDSGLSLNAANKSMWKVHVEVYGDTCDNDCPCPADLKLLTRTVKTDNETTARGKPVGFVGKFAPKFYSKLKKEFPDSSPADLLRKLLKMWACHSDDTRFGPRCRSKCACGDAWKLLFLDECLRPKLPEKVPKKKRSPPAPDAASAASTAPATTSIPKKKRKVEPNKVEPNASRSTSSATLSIPKKTRKVEADTITSSLVPLRPSKQSALTQRITIKRKEREDTQAGRAAGASSMKVQPSLPRGRPNAPSLTLMREYLVSFNPKEPLGFFVVTEPKKHGAGNVCKITSVSPATSSKDPRLQPGTIVVATGEPQSSVTSHVELRKRYDDARADGKDLVLHFINADVTASKMPMVKPSSAIGAIANRDWSSSGVWRGFSRVAGWAGGSKLQQRQEDLEGAQQLKSSRARHMPSVSRYMRSSRSTQHQGTSTFASTVVDPYSSNSNRATSSMALASNKGNASSSSIGQSGPLRSILRKESKANTVVANEETEDASASNDDDNDEARSTKVKFVPDPVLEQVKHFSEVDEQQMIIDEPLPPPGLKQEGNDALSYAVEFQTYDEVISLLGSGAYVNQIDSEGRYPMDRAMEKFDTLKRERQNLKTKSSSQVVNDELELNDAAMKDANLKFQIMRLHRDSETIIDMAYYLRDWTKMEITVKGAQGLELTSKGQAQSSSDYLYCTFTGRDGRIDKQHAPKVPFSCSPVWNNAASYVVEYNNDLEDLQLYKVEVILYKGDPKVPEDSLRISKWKPTLDQIRQFGEKQKFEEINPKLQKNAYLIDGSLLIGEFCFLHCISFGWYH